MWKLQSSLFAASQGLEWLAIVAAVGAVALLLTRFVKKDAKGKGNAQLEWTTPLLIALMGACLYGASLLTLRASNRVLKANVLDLSNEIASFAKAHESMPEQQPGEKARHYIDRMLAEGHELEQQYHDQYVDKVKYAREQLAQREVSDSELDRFYVDPTNPVTLHIIADRLEVMSRKL